MNGDDLDDIRVGLDCLSKTRKSIQAAQSNMRHSNEKRDAEMALQHAEEVATIAERMFRSVLPDTPREARNGSDAGPKAESPM